MTKTKLTHKHHRNTLRTKIYDDETGLFVNHYDLSLVKEWYPDYNRKYNTKQKYQDKIASAILNSIVDKGIEESVLRQKIRSLYVRYDDFKREWLRLWQDKRNVNRDIYEPEWFCLYKDRDTNLVYYSNKRDFGLSDTRNGLSKTEFRKERAKERNKPKTKKINIVKYIYFKRFSDNDLQLYFNQLILEENKIQDNILWKVKLYNDNNKRAFANLNEHEKLKFAVMKKKANYTLNKEIKLSKDKLALVQLEIEALLDDDLSYYHKSKYYLNLKTNEELND